MFRNIFIIIVLVFAIITPASATTFASKNLKMKRASGEAQIVKIATKKLIGSSRAARIAQSVAPTDKLLEVRLSRGASPMYVVKTRGNGRVREIVIDAHTGTVVKR